MDVILNIGGLYQCAKCGRYLKKEELICREEKLYGKVIRTREACPVCKGIVVLVKDHHFTPQN